MWQALTVGGLFLVGGIAGFYMGWGTRADDERYREDGPAGLPDSQWSKPPPTSTSELKEES